MSEVQAGANAWSAVRCENGNAAASRAADWLGLAAAPTFAVMALLTGFLGGDLSETLCSAAQGPFPPSGMVWMYVLMSAIHLPPWLRLVSSRQSGGGS